ncbi:sensor histidine kinase [Nocardia terpenica]|uniref:Two-component sensor histidine kinase n=2 Tax=Nocardia terpenica TaxID=455432 RepID=A0A291RWQ8_9NOCA|nr:two-component sensor histidine kinase [Nocardia terpenica]
MSPVQRAWFGVFLVVVWSAVLISPIREKWRHDVLGGSLAVACTVILGVLIVVAMTWFRRFGPDDPADQKSVDRRAWAVVAGMVASCLALTGLLGIDALSSFLYVAAVAVLILPRRESGYVVAATVGIIVIVALQRHDWHSTGLAVVLCIVPVFIWIAREIGTRGQRLRELARAQRAELAVVEERNRVARDVHDILGHSLTIITVKTELAQRLMDIDPARARTEMADVERLAREALAGVRDTVGGLREMSLSRELANARTALHAAGVEAEIPADPGLPSERGVVLGWVLREAVTNVVRHSAARHCTVLVSESGIEISDDGIGLGADTEFGSGLSGLRERVRAAGGTLTVGRAADGGLRVAATFPETRRLS